MFRQNFSSVRHKFDFLDDELGRAAFGSFLRKEYSEENLLFWEDCIRLEQMDDDDDMREHINDIIYKYIG